MLMLFLLIIFNYPYSLCVCMCVWHSVHLKVWKQLPSISSVQPPCVSPGSNSGHAIRAFTHWAAYSPDFLLSYASSYSFYNMPDNASFIQDCSFSQLSVYKCCLYFCFSKCGLNKKPKLSVQVHTWEALVHASCFQVSPAVVFLIRSRSALTV